MALDLHLGLLGMSKGLNAFVKQHRAVEESREKDSLTIRAFGKFEDVKLKEEMKRIMSNADLIFEEINHQTPIFLV
jgi:hypothetical protein